MRLQQFLARAGIASRRKAEDLIRAGRITINHQVATIGAKVHPGDQVMLDGERVRLPQKKLVIALNKPLNYTTTHEDKHAQKLVYDLVPQHPGLHAVGRLDKDTEGLLLLTNDGDLTQLLTHPRNQVPKLYRAWSQRGRVSKETCRQLTQGVMLGDGLARALEATPTHDGVRLVLAEGRKREVRRMLGKVGHPVKRLVRLAVGPMELGELEVGAWRYLSSEEIRLLRSLGQSARGRKPTQAQSQKHSDSHSQRASTTRPRAATAPPSAITARSKPPSPKTDIRATKPTVESSRERVSGRTRKSTDQRGPDRRPSPRTRRPDKT